MTRTIEIGIPTRNGSLRGLLYPVPHARVGKPRRIGSRCEQTPHLRLVRSTSAGSRASRGAQSRSAPVTTFRIDEHLPRRLTVQLGDDADLSRHAAPLIAKLYTWCRSTL